MNDDSSRSSQTISIEYRANNGNKESNSYLTSLIGLECGAGYRLSTLGTSREWTITPTSRNSEACITFAITLDVTCLTNKTLHNSSILGIIATRSCFFSFLIFVFY